MPHYRYTVITPETSAEHEFDGRFWANHPDWRFFVRTDHRVPHNPCVWAGGGGATLEDALRSAELSLTTWHYPLGLVATAGPIGHGTEHHVLGPMTRDDYTREESRVPIRNR